MDNQSYKAASAAVAKNLEKLRALLEGTGIKAAGDKDYNSQDAKFIRKMIKHHEMAVEMSDTEADKGKNDEATTLAKAIRKAQKAEITQMKKWLKDRDLSEGDDDGGM